MADRKTLEDVIQQLVEVNDKLINNQITLPIAKQVSINTQTLINGAKLQLDIYKQTKQITHFIDLSKTIEPKVLDLTEKTLIECKEIAENALKLNKDDDEEIIDKRPFPFNNGDK